MKKNILFLSILVAISIIQAYAKNPTSLIVYDQMDKGSVIDTTTFLFFLDGKKSTMSTIGPRLASGEVEVVAGYSDAKAAILHFGEKSRHGIGVFKTAGKEILSESFQNIDNEITLSNREAKGNCLIKGKAPAQFNNQPVMLFKFRNDTICAVDTTIVKNEEFTFYSQEYLDEESLISVGNYPTKSLSAFLILEQGTINLDLNNVPDGRKRLEVYHSDGTDLNNKLKSYYDTTTIILDEWRVLKEKSGEPKNSTVVGSATHLLIQKLEAFKTTFIKENINNVAGKMIFKRELSNLSITEIEDICKLAEEDLSSNPEVIKQLKLKREKEQQTKTLEASIGMTYTDFEFYTLDGKAKLSDYIGKSEFILIDFWASWCGPCIADIPNLKKIYEKYKSKGLSVISISIDSSKPTWKRSLEKQKMPWTQLLVKEGEEKKLMGSYHFISIPHIILLDKEGKIIEVNLRGPKLEYMLNLITTKHD